MSDGEGRDHPYILDTVFENYTLSFEPDSDYLDVYCETCSEIVCVLDYHSAAKLTELELYEEIIEHHEPIE